MAVEDAAVLGDLFSRVKSIKQVPALLQAYEDLRYVPLPLPSFPQSSNPGKQAAARDGDAAVVPSEPEDFPPPRWA